MTQTELVRIGSDGEASDDEDSDFSQASSESGESTDDDLISIGEELIGDGEDQDPVAVRKEGDPINEQRIPEASEAATPSERNALDEDGKL